MSAAIEVRILTADDLPLLQAAGRDVFDEAVQPGLAAEFLADPRHHIAAAIDAGRIVGFASAVSYVHPDKPAELWINEVGVAADRQREGLGRALMRTILEHARSLGCAEAWVLTERSNEPARKLYAAAGGDEDAAVYVTFRLSEEK